MESIREDLLLAFPHFAQLPLPKTLNSSLHNGLYSNAEALLGYVYYNTHNITYEGLIWK